MSAVTMAIALLAINEPETGSVIVLGLGMLCFQFAIGLANDIVDAADDAKSKPWKAIPRGVLSRQAAIAASA
ncbi:MAG TPA: UbiA family prenyltransferase, partial [Tepidiformaceae bacterium]|nr:UbiA family prenyltransferase [Tepidiformaceae bacterium]